MNSEIKVELEQLLKWNREHCDSSYVGQFSANMWRIIQLVKRMKPEKERLYFITVNPAPQKVGFPEFKIKVDTFCERSVLQKCWWTFEQRGITEEECGKGFHAHILLTSQYSKSYITRAVQNTFKDIIGNPLHIDVKKYPVCYKQDKIDYLLGIKWDPEKGSKLEVDRLFRARNNLDPIYINGLLSKGPDFTEGLCQTTDYSLSLSTEEASPDQEGESDSSWCDASHGRAQV